MWGLKKNWHCLGLFLRLFWTFHLTFSKPPSYILSGTHQILFPLVAYCDKWVIWKLRQTNILRPFLDIFEKLPETQIFFCKITPLHSKNCFFWIFQKIFFSNRPRSFFLSKSSYSICHDSKMEIVLKNYSKKYFWRKYFTKIFSISVTPFWNRETKCCNLALKKGFGAIWKKRF